MKRILAKGQRDVLEQLAWSNVLLAFDFDGTLAPIVDEPEAAVMRPLTRRLFRRVAELYPCIVISGRAANDVHRRLDGIALRSVLGNHGLEPWRATEDFSAAVKAWKRVVDGKLAPLTGVEIEDKAYSLAIHYRRSRQKKSALTSIHRIASRLTGARIIGGKQVVNIVPLGAPHKGMALERERERLGCDTAFYIGDDETDEDVFALDEPGRLLTVRVGASRTSQASYCIASQSDVDVLLTRLVDLRASTNGSRRKISP